MSFLSKFKSGSTPTSLSAGHSGAKRDANAPLTTLLEQRLADATGPVRADGSDKFFGFENYGSTCYCNSIIQCLYYSAPFRENILNFPSKAFLADTFAKSPNGTVLPPPKPSTSPYPNPTSPARKPAMPTSPGGIVRPEESKESPEYKKRQALTAGPVLDMTQDNSTKYGMDESLFTSLRDIFEAIIDSKSRVGVVSPHRFLEILRRENEMFRSAMHQDAHEFLNLLLNQVMDNVENFSKRYPSSLPPPVANGIAPAGTAATDMAAALNRVQTRSDAVDAHWVHDLFEGQLTSETRCLTCETTSQRDEAFLDLSVDLSAHTSVTSCLRKFSEEEMLCERNKFHCDTCGGLQEAEKRMKIKRLPRILALHLKRFKYTEDLQRLQKLFHRIVYPFHMRLFNTTDDAEDADRLYELYAVVVHIGGGPYHGHYVSIIKTQDRGWLLFDDEMVEPVDKSYVLNFFGGEPVPGLQDAKQLACAYVLFYQETTLDAVLREQEAEGQPASSRASDAEQAKESFTSSHLHHTTTIATPIHDDAPIMEPLAHAQTTPQSFSPTSPHPARPPAEPLPTAIPAVLQSRAPTMQPPKSKKELKQEEKDRKAAEKARLKADEARKRGDGSDDGSSGTASAIVPSTAAATVEKRDSGLARFRHGSMSLRSKPRPFFSSKEKEKVLPIQDTQANGVATAPTAEYSAEAHAVTALPAASADHPSAGEVKKHRFGLGRKKSAALT